MSWEKVLLVVAAAGCAAGPAPARSPPVAKPAAEKVAGRCGTELGPSPFRNSQATHVLIADFYGVGANDPRFADGVTGQIDAELRRFREEELPKMPVAIPDDAAEFQRLRCFVDSHSQADEIAAAWGADLVIWGRAYCDVKPEVQRLIEVQQTISTGAASAREGATVTIGQVNVEGPPKPYAVCPSATLHRREAPLRRSSEKSIEFGSLAHLDLPTLSSTAPFQLIQFTLGLHFYERQQPWIAARFFERSAKDILSPADRNLTYLHAYLGRAFLDLPDGTERALEYSRNALRTFAGTRTSVEAFLLTNIGRGLQTQGKFAEAVEHYQRARSIDEQVLGASDLATANDLCNIGSALDEQGKSAEAIAHFQQALVVLETRAGKRHPWNAIVLNYLGMALARQGRFEESVDAYQRALSIREPAFGDDNPLTGGIWNNLGMSLTHEGRYDEAIACFRSALGIAERSLGADHPSTANVLGNLGHALDEQGQPAEALEHLRQAHRIHLKALGQDNPATAQDLSSIGLVLQRHGKYAEAIEQLEGARRVLETTLGLEHPVTTVARGSLARAIAGSSGRREDTGAVVGRVPADETRLELGDWIVRYDGRSIDDPDALLELMDETEGRRAVAVEIVRKHQRLKLRVQGGRLELELWD